GRVDANGNTIQGIDPFQSKRQVLPEDGSLYFIQRSGEWLREAVRTLRGRRAVEADRVPMSVFQASPDRVVQVPPPIRLDLAGLRPFRQRLEYTGADEQVRE